MPIDFTEFQYSNDQLPIHPKEIFSALSRRAPGFGYLRDVQGQVLDRWYLRRNDRDISIKMNTGTGKTAVGFLMLLSSIREGYSPALYVTPDNYLVRQAGQQADNLGILWTDDPDSSAYLSGDAIGIVNVYRLVNGRSIFGGPSGRLTHPVPIGALVIDDAHACVSTIEQQTTVTIPNHHKIYQKSLQLFRPDLRIQSHSQLLDLENQEPGLVMRISISTWLDRHRNLIEIINPYQNDEILQFSWPFVRNILPSCQGLFSSDTFEIRPFCPPTSMISSLEQVERRIFLTATLPDDSVLITHFGASEESACNPVTPRSAADIGDRLILAPLELNPVAHELHIRDVVRRLAKNYNVVVLVPSYRRADVWKDYADRIAGKDEIDAAVMVLRSDSRAGLTVLVNKYDGIDLPGDPCRVLVIDGVPEAITNSERREAEVLGGSDLIAFRKLQRIEQGMGRGVRSAEDYCVVLLMGSSLTRVLARPHMRDRLGPATRAQLDLSMALVAKIEGQGLQEVVDVIEQCLSRDPGWLALSRNCLSGIEYPSGSIEPFAVSFRRAFDVSVTSQYGAAVRDISDAINLVTDTTTKGWLQELLAAYMQSIDPPQAQHVLAGAIQHNRRVLRPNTGVDYRRISSGVDQSEAAYNALVGQFEDANSLILGFRDLAERLAIGTRAPVFEDAIEKLGTLLGFQSQRPERDTGKGPDNLWCLGRLRFLVVECKSEAKSDVWKRDAGQLAQSMNWFIDKYDNTCKAMPVLIHHSGHHASDATPPSGGRVIDKRRLGDLRKSFDQYGRTLAARWPFDSEDVRQVLQYQNLMGTVCVDRYTRGLA
ncbi:MAG: DEAD/DEAH box helicase [bacterium]|nr:DEAD/DEAH box helicase [bacterium]